MENGFSFITGHAEINWLQGLFDPAVNSSPTVPHCSHSRALLLELSLSSGALPSAAVLAGAVSEIRATCYVVQRKRVLLGPLEEQGGGV